MQEGSLARYRVWSKVRTPTANTSHSGYKMDLFGRGIRGYSMQLESVDCGS